MLAANGILSYFDISLTAKVLGLCLVLEILMLALMAFAVLLHGGGPQGMVVESINPLNAFRPAEGVVGANAGIGLFFAFWSWVGFESSAMYGEESRNPKKIIPLATLLAVIGIGCSTSSSPGWPSPVPARPKRSAWRRTRPRLPRCSTGRPGCTWASGR
jgi:amino acid transporter